MNELHHLASEYPGQFKQKQLQLQHNQEQLNVRYKISAQESLSDV